MMRKRGLVFGMALLGSCSTILSGTAETGEKPAADEAAETDAFVRGLDTS